MGKMKTVMTVLSLAYLSLSINSCMKSDIDNIRKELQEHEERLTILEAWQAETNTNIQALQTLLSTTDYITEVTPVMKDGVEVGFIISFLNTPAITIYHGTKGDKGDKGDTPQISVAQGDDSNWYWTLNGEFLTDVQGNLIQANGTKGDTGEQGPEGEQGSAGKDASLPQLTTGTKLTDQGINTDSQGDSIVTDAIYLSVDGGTTWTRVSGEDGEDGKDGEKGETGDTGSTGPTGPTGDSFFKGVDTSNSDYIIFTLADGITFQVSRYTGISLTFNPTNVFLSYGETMKIQCTAGGSAEFTTDNLFVIFPTGWKVEIVLTRSVSTEFTLTVTAPNEDSEGEILVMLDNKKGSTTIGRMPVKTVILGSELDAEGLVSGKVADIIGERTDLTSVILKNCELNSSDWSAICNNKSLVTIDLGESTYNSYSFNYQSNISSNNTLRFLAVPNGVKTISSESFNKFLELTSVTIPTSVEKIQSESFYSCGKLTNFTIPADSKLTVIGKEAFERCYKLESIFIPATVKTIEKMAFNMCKSLKSVTFAEGSQLTEIPYYCFADNDSLTTIEIPPLVTTLGNSVFLGCAKLANITIPAAMTSIEEKAFSSCPSLVTVTCLAETPPTLGEKAFNNCAAGLQILVPSGSVNAYKEAWSDYADKIKAIH